MLDKLQVFSSYSYRTTGWSLFALFSSRDKWSAIVLEVYHFPLLNCSRDLFYGPTMIKQRKIWRQNRCVLQKKTDSIFRTGCQQEMLTFLGGKHRIPFWVTGKYFHSTSATSQGQTVWLNKYKICFRCLETWPVLDSAQTAWFSVNSTQSVIKGDVSVTSCLLIALSDLISQ